jgi:hypothetical protein
MPAGTVEELRAATGQPFSRLVRYTMLAYLERLRIERRQREGLDLQNKTARDIKEIVDKDCDERGL